MTVSHSHTVIAHANTLGLAMASTVVKTDPISTMNMTGFRHSVAGFSLRSASGVAFHSCLGSSRPPPTRRRAAGAGAATDVTDMGVRFLSGVSEGLGQRAEREGGEVGQGHDDEGDADDHADEQRSVRGQRAARCRYGLLAGQ